MRLSNIISESIPQFPDSLLSAWEELLPHIKKAKASKKSEFVKISIDTEGFYKSKSIPKAKVNVFLFFNEKDLELFHANNRWLTKTMATAGSWIPKNKTKPSADLINVHDGLKDGSMSVKEAVKIIKRYEQRNRTRVLYDNEISREVLIKLLKYPMPETTRGDIGEGVLALNMNIPLEELYNVFTHEMAHAFDLGLYHLTNIPMKNDGHSYDDYLNFDHEIFARATSAFETLKRLLFDLMAGKPKKKNILFRYDLNQFENDLAKTLEGLKKGENAGFFPKYFDIKLIRDDKTKKKYIMKWYKALTELKSYF
jgi:hypothetical protein